LLRGDTDSTRSYPSLSTIACRESRGDILDVTTPIGWGGCAALPFNRYTVEEDDHERYRCGSDPGQSGKAKTAPCIWVARGRLCPDGGALWGRAQPNRDSTPPTPSAPLYRLNHSIGGPVEPVNHASYSDAWGRGLVVPPLRSPLPPASLRYSITGKIRGSGLHAIPIQCQAGGGRFDPFWEEGA
jgi:hypothetical protein